VALAHQGHGGVGGDTSSPIPATADGAADGDGGCGVAATADAAAEVETVFVAQVII
jgi:hypothetical protein